MELTEAQTSATQTERVPEHNTQQCGVRLYSTRMELARHRSPIQGLKRCLAVGVISLPLAGSFCSVPGAARISSSGSDSHHHRHHSSHFRGPSPAAAVFVADGAPASPTARSRRSAATAGATLFTAEEEAALEEKGAGHLPPWELIPFSETFDQLQRELIRCVVCVQFVVTVVVLKSRGL